MISMSSPRTTGKGGQTDAALWDRIAELCRAMEPSVHIANVLGVSERLVRKVRAHYGIKPPPSRSVMPGLSYRSCCPECGARIEVALVRGRAVAVDVTRWEGITAHRGTSAGVAVVVRRKHVETCAARRTTG